MDAKEFLTLLLPQDGFIVIAPQRRVVDETGKVHTKHRNLIVRSIEEAVSVAATQTWEGKDVFFALATYKEEKVWNPNVRNLHTGEMGKYETRTQRNALALKCFFLDLDIDPNPITYAEDGVKVINDKSDKTFLTHELAVEGVKRLCKAVGMPRPMMLSSGGGIHCYWPMTEQVEAATWKATAEKFKAICRHLKVTVDPAVPADSARILRLLGTYNFKKEKAREVSMLCLSGGMLPFEAYDLRFSTFIEDNGVELIMPSTARHSNPAGAASILGDNMGATNNPVNPDLMAFHCEQFARQIQNRGAGASEPLWYTMVGLAKFCEKQDDVLMAVSDGHAEFDAATTRAKMDRWMAPATCARIDTENPGICGTCPMWGKIKSPAVMGNLLRNDEAPKVPPMFQQNLSDPDPTPVLELPNPPEPYVRYNGKVVTQHEDKDGKPIRETIVPFDMYPVRVIRQAGKRMEVKEVTMWCFTLDRLGQTYVEIPQRVLANPQSLSALIMEKGGYINPSKIKEIQAYMSAYLRELTRMVDREKMYEQFGWQADENPQEFMLGESVIHRDGTITKHHVSPSALMSTKNSIKTAGTFEAWYELMKFYNRPGYEGTRMFIYGSFGSPLLSMTMYKALLFAASGESGRGKSTTMEAQASIWGNPNGYLINGNNDGITTNALYNNLSVYHNLPFLIDETTERDAVEMRKFSLAATSGIGKERMKGNEHDGNIRTWAAFIFTSANINELARIASVSKSSTPHMARVIAVDFELQDMSAEAKIKADEFKYGLRENYGWAGLHFMRYVTQNYEQVRQRVLDTIADLDRRVSASAMERFWSAGVGTAFVGGCIAYELGLIPFDPRKDFEWMCTHIRSMRDAVGESNLTPIEQLSEFLNANISNTLVMSALHSGNIGNVALMPRMVLNVRVEMDSGTLYIARPALIDYCAKHKADFRHMENGLVASGVIVAKNKQKTLGADTQFGYGGQVRCWQIDASKLGASYNAALQQAMQAMNQAPVKP